MAQAYITTYQTFFRWPEIERRKSLRPVDRFSQELPAGNIWIVPKRIGEDTGEGGLGLAEVKAAIHRMHRKRIWTTYQVDYCKDMIPKDPSAEDSQGMEDALLFYCKNLYSPKTQKIPLPVPTSRRINGYVRPSTQYMPLTTYQVTHGHVGYQVLDSNNSRALKEASKNEKNAAVPKMAIILEQEIHEDEIPKKKRPKKDKFDSKENNQKKNCGCS